MSPPTRTPRRCTGIPGRFRRTRSRSSSSPPPGWLVDTDFRWAGFQYALDGENAIGLSLTQLDYGEDEVTTVTNPNGTGERWSAQDLSVGLSYCRRLTDRFSMGGTVKWIEQRVYNESASTVAFDLGLLFITDFNDLRLGRVDDELRRRSEARRTRSADARSTSILRTRDRTSPSSGRSRPMPGRSR